ncbi:MAG: pyridoxal phosphate-dependent aminotransferase [Candidatus Micrarchaeota archaeon]
MSAYDKTRLNRAVPDMGGYTLRKTDVNEAAERAGRLGRRVMDARLGDPTAFGLAPFPRYVALVEEAMWEPRSWSYQDARGLAELRDTLGRGNPETRKGDYRIPPERVFVGPGISGVSRFLFSAMIDRGNDEVAIPEWSYIIYFAEAALSEAKVVNVPLTESGEVDVQRLKDAIGKRTKAVFITTVGNPLGIAMKQDTFAAIIRAVNEKERELNQPVYLVADTIYEGFRTGSEPIDPIGMSARLGRLGPTIELHSISKLIGAPGARLGWMRVYHEGADFKDEVGAFIDALSMVFQPSLGSNSTAFQLALQRLYSELAEQARGDDFDRFRRNRRGEVISRTRTLLEALAGISGLAFPQAYMRDGRVCPELVNSPYVLFGVDKGIRPRGGLSQARQMADFLIDRGALPVLLTTPGDNFLANGLRGQGQEFVRAVALFERCDAAVEAIGAFAGVSL